MISKTKLVKSKREWKTIELAHRYQRIGIGAVVAVLRCQQRETLEDKSENNKRNRGPPKN